jgi:hypothetical protein
MYRIHDPAAPSRHQFRQPGRARGFALVVTLSLMILLTVIAVGLLTLSSISLRGSGQGEAMQIAKANARLALMLAIGDLQKAAGPDQRVTITADQQKKAADGKETSAAFGNRHWTGVFRSWPADSASRPAPEFLSWLVSGNPNDTERDALALQELPEPAAGAKAENLVDIGTLGSNTDDLVRVPTISILQNNKPAKLAWWVGDQGVKAALATPPLSEDKASLGVVRGNLQSAPRNASEIASAGNVQPFSQMSPDDARMQLVTSWRQAGFLASDPAAPGPLFHDLAACSTGLLTNVVDGGFRKDLSLQLETPSTKMPTTALYTVGGGNGINLGELWTYYNSYKDIRRAGSFNFTTSGRLSSKTPYLMTGSSPTACARDEYFHIKQPVVISYQMVLSLKAIPVDPTTTLLHVVSDPIVTLWNPLDIPVVIPTGAFISVKYWQIPYDIIVNVNNSQKVRAPLAASLSGVTSTAEQDLNYLSIQLGTSAGGQMVFKPGEVIKFSQSGGMIEMKNAGYKNSLIARKGFNYGGGYAMPLKDLDGKTLAVKDGDSITYEAYANHLTAGKKHGSGNSVTGGEYHSRHFSMTHHEVYVGKDRDELPNSLGYGNMSIDWDFGNKRLLPGEVRGGGAGTKPTNERLYANRFPEVFRPLTAADARPLSFNQLVTEKSPFLLISYDAKTELNSETGTRFLSRFNPKAHHVDFYDLSQTERDMLPYEFRAEPLVSWANRSLDLSPDGSGFFGGGMTAQDGTGIVSTHSIPREPLVSLAAFQHSFANGFEIHKPVPGYAALNAREPMMPQISHAIGNSLAPPMMDPGQTEGTLSGGRPLADHSYLANRALWDAWFLSGVAPRERETFPADNPQKTVASEFFSGTSKLPVVRYLPDVGTEDPGALANSFFSGATPNDTGIENLASYLRVDGLFNVNSTSIEAWKAVLGSLKGRPIVVRDASGKESIASASDCPVMGLQHPENIVANGSGNLDVKDPSQWVGRRELTDAEIDQLARALVIEIRKRGPFLSLADFVNRRVGSDEELAKAGALQCALDSNTVEINKAFNNARAVGAAKDRFKFPKAEEGALAYGIPGYVKQADILTPIAPVLAARSDSFIVRGYGESVDGGGRVTARAWCEAVVERDRNWVDPADDATDSVTSLSSEANRTFGRRFEILSFRWLSASEV